VLTVSTIDGFGRGDFRMTTTKCMHYPTKFGADIVI